MGTTGMYGVVGGGGVEPLVISVVTGRRGVADVGSVPSPVTIIIHHKRHELSTLYLVMYPLGIVDHK